MNPAIQALAKKFLDLELHAARGGREVRRILLEELETNIGLEDSTAEDLLKILRTMVIYLLPALPPYAPPFRSINDILIIVEKAAASGQSAAETLRSLKFAAKATTGTLNIAQKVAESLLSNMSSPLTLYTHTLSETVLNAILLIHAQGMVEQVFVTESRPNADGNETARRLASAGLRTYLTIDAAMPAAISASDRMLTGAEAIGPSGDVIGKVGAFSAAVLCRLFKKPITVVADTSKILPIPLKYLEFSPLRAEDIKSSDDCILWQPFGSFFDLTPCDYIEFYATERGLWSIVDVDAEVKHIPFSPWLVELVGANKGE
ncbi:MAG: hypothetical protein WA109_09635 [Bellilinea sp.]